MKPLEEKELLLRVATKVAAKQLEEGGFFPFGATLSPNRQVQLLVPESMKRDATKDELDAYWGAKLLAAANAARCNTVCSCADSGVLADDGSVVRAVFIHIEHAYEYSEDILYPYRKGDGPSVSFEKPTIEPTKHQVFT